MPNPNLRVYRFRARVRVDLSAAAWLIGRCMGDLAGGRARDLVGHAGGLVGGLAGSTFTHGPTRPHPRVRVIDRYNNNDVVSLHRSQLNKMTRLWLFVDVDGKK